MIGEVFKRLDTLYSLRQESFHEPVGSAARPPVSRTAKATVDDAFFNSLRLADFPTVIDVTDAKQIPVGAESGSVEDGRCRAKPKHELEDRAVVP
jgi:hypothetical protein